MVQKLFVLICVSVSWSSFASVPQPTDISHPGSQANLIDYQRYDERHLGRASAVYLPDRDDRAPLVVFGHGQAIGEDGYDATLKHLAQKGVAVLFVMFDDGFFDQNWRRMASDWNEITKAVLAKYPDQIDPDRILYAGHSKGGYVGLMAAGAPNAPKVDSLVLFAPAGYDSDYLKALPQDSVLTLVWGERDTIIDRQLMDEIYRNTTIQKQMITVRSYPDRAADHSFILNRRFIFGGQNGVGPFHFHGVWKWLVGAAWDLEAGGERLNPYIYGDETGTSGDDSVLHEIRRSWDNRGEYLFKLSEAGSLSALNLSMATPIFGRWYKAVLSTRQVQALRNSPQIEKLGKNHQLKSLSLPNDYREEFWNLKSLSGIDVRAEQAWQETTGRQDVVVAIVDSGFQHQHTDLKKNVWVNQVELNGEKGVDDDNNGYIDDVHGFNFASNQANASDNRGHGTQVAGLIGAEANNGQGIVGMAWDVQMMSLNMFPNLWGNATLESAVKAIRYAVHNGAQIINASWGQADEDLKPDEGFQILWETIEEANKANVLFVAAAGNNGNDNDEKGMVPATLDNSNILSVGAMNSKGERWLKSNFGANNVDIFAPGESIITTQMGGGTKMSDGTSLSAPIVSGIAALMLAVNPSLTPQQIIQIMVDSCDPHPRLQVLSRCGGFINAAKAIKEARQ